MTSDPDSKSSRWLIFSNRHANQLPESVQLHIRSRQQSSEVLIGWVQLAVVILFGGLYYASPSSPASSIIQPVPWALTLYLLFTLVRLILAYKRKLPNWMLIVSILIDILLLMVLIWTFHLQYEQPPSFYLKVPTLLYVFVFISLRALRFEARYVLLAGLIASLGWLCNVAYAVYYDMADNQSMPMMTRDYVEYMTSNSIMIGAELDKIISILVVTGIIAFAISRAKATMIEAATFGSTAQALSRFVPNEVAENIIHSDDEPSAGQTERGDATILFLDIESFTRVAENLQPEVLVNTLNEFFARVSAPIRELDGVITQFQGDAILASFNLPKQNTDHASNAISAAIQIQNILSECVFANDLRLKARIGINSGIVVGGLVGTDEQVSYTVHGDTVNLAARLEQMNKQHGTRILISRSSVDAAGASFCKKHGVVSLGEFEIRGHRKPIEALTVEGLV